MNTTTSSNDHPVLGLTIQLPAKLLDVLHDIVTEKGININTLISGYISNGVEHDLPVVHRKCFFNHVKEVLKKHNVPSEAITEIGEKFSY
ncbi:MAG: hypothetical protein PHI06_06395 [Desulfobulbaceae bacterium]|nr:hypothetical protein [Desulfobulbaceae bacterium]